MLRRHDPQILRCWTEHLTGCLSLLAIRLMIIATSELGTTYFMPVAPDKRNYVGVIDI